jgi:hypothetical protein
LGDVVVNWLLYLDDLVHLNDLVYRLGHLDDLWELDSLHDDLGDDFGNPDDLFLVEWNLNAPIYNLFHLLVQGNRLINDLLDLFNTISVDDLLLDHSHLLDGWHLHLDLHDLLNGLGYFYDLLDSLDDLADKRGRASLGPY